MNEAQQRERIYPLATQTNIMTLGSGERVRFYEDEWFSEVILATDKETYDFFSDDEEAANKKYEKKGIIFPHGGAGIVTGIQLVLLNPNRGAVDYSTPATAEAVAQLGRLMVVQTKIGDRQITNDRIGSFLPTVIPGTAALQFNAGSPTNHDQIKRFSKGGFELNEKLKFEVTTKTFCGFKTPAALDGYKLHYVVHGKAFLPANA